MKKIVCILLVVVMFVMIFTIPAYASSETESGWKYYDTVKEYAFDYSSVLLYMWKKDFEEDYGEAVFYEVVDEQPVSGDDEIQFWWLIKAATDVKTVETDTIRCYVNGDVVFHEKDLYEPFNTPYCVYEWMKTRFVDVTEVDLEDTEYFPMLKYHVLYYDIGTLIGDLDNDDTVTILDATETQRIVAQISEATICDCIADFDQDGDTTIFDATAIQMKLAKIEA